MDRTDRRARCVTPTGDHQQPRGPRRSFHSRSASHPIHKRSCWHRSRAPRLPYAFAASPDPSSGWRRHCGNQPTMGIAELRPAVCVQLDRVSVLVDMAVVQTAQKRCVPQAGLAALRPVLNMMASRKIRCVHPGYVHVLSRLCSARLSAPAIVRRFRPTARVGVLERTSPPPTTNGGPISAEQPVRIASGCSWVPVSLMKMIHFDAGGDTRTSGIHVISTLGRAVPLC